VLPAGSSARRKKAGQRHDSPSSSESKFQSRSPLRTTQIEAAEAIKISKAQLSDVIRQKKGVSANLALRVQFCFGVPGDLLIRLQAQFDFQKAFHSKNKDLQMEVRAIA
jgi:addiction module HigA family antidote